MLTLTNVTITKVDEGKSGKNKYGPWQAYSLWITDPDWEKIRFSYMQSGDKIVPEKGMELDFLEFEKEDKYYNVKKIQPKGEKPKPEPETTDKTEKPVPPRENPKSMYYSYVKDVAVALINAGKSATQAEEWIMLIVNAGEFIFEAAEKGAPKPKGKPEGAPKEKGKGKPGAPKDKETLNLKPLLKLMASKIVDVSEKTAQALLPAGMTVSRHNAIADLLKSQEGDIEIDLFLEEINRIIGEESEGE